MRLAFLGGGLFGRLRLGTATTIALSVCFMVVRIFLVRSYYAHDGAQHAGFMAAHQASPAAPASSWVIFATTDQDTQIRTQHARLRAEPPDPARATGQVDDFLELSGIAHAHQDAVLTLASVPVGQCPAIDHIEAAFDERKPHVFATEPAGGEGVCALKIASFDRLLQEMLNAQTLVVRPKSASGDLQAVAFRVGGLTWE